MIALEDLNHLDTELKFNSTFDNPELNGNVGHGAE